MSVWQWNTGSIGFIDHIYAIDFLGVVGLLKEQKIIVALDVSFKADGRLIL
jgi:hypothetical protein